MINDIPNYDVKILLGDLNAQIGDDRDGLEHTIGPHGSATHTSENRYRLLSLCGMNGLCIGNTYFAHKTIHKKRWRSPNGNTSNEIDYLCISNRWRSALRDVRVFRGADVGSDHYLVVIEIRLRLKKLQAEKPIRPYAIEEQWSAFKQVVTNSADAAIGRRRGSQMKRWIQDRTRKLIDERKMVKCRRN